MTKQKIRWGVISTAKIGREKVIPGIQKASNSEVTAIASRNREQADKTARLLNIGKAFGSYEELLADPAIDAVYIPLPNHLHVEWAVKAIRAGKHVLCEKPVALSAAQAEELLTVAGKHPKIKVMEAFMYRFHPQWKKVKEAIDSGAISTPIRRISATRPTSAAARSWTSAATAFPFHGSCSERSRSAQSRPSIAILS